MCQVAVVLLLLLRRSYGLFALEINQLQNYYYYYYHPVNGIRVDAIESSSSSLVQSWLHHKTTALHLPRLWVGISISVHRYYIESFPQSQFTKRPESYAPPIN